MASHSTCPCHGDAQARSPPDPGHIHLSPGYMELSGGPSGEPVMPCHSLGQRITVHSPNQENVECTDTINAPDKGSDNNSYHRPAAREFHCHTPNYPCCRKIVHTLPKAPPHPCREQPHAALSTSQDQAHHTHSHQTPCMQRNEEQERQPSVQHQRPEAQHHSSHASPAHQGPAEQHPARPSCKPLHGTPSPDDGIAFWERPTHSPACSHLPQPSQIDPCQPQAPKQSTSSEKQATRQTRNIVYNTSPQYEELVPVPSCKPSGTVPSHFNHLSFKDKQLVMTALKKTAPTLQHANLLQERDKNNSGCIGKRDFETVMDKVGCLKDLSSRELEAIFKGFPSRNDAVLDYKKFICACEELVNKPAAF